MSQYMITIDYKNIFSQKNKLKKKRINVKKLSNPSRFCNDYEFTIWCDKFASHIPDSLIKCTSISSSKILKKNCKNKYTFIIHNNKNGSGKIINLYVLHNTSYDILHE